VEHGDLDTHGLPWINGDSCGLWPPLHLPWPNAVQAQEIPSGLGLGLGSRPKAVRLCGLQEAPQGLSDDLGGCGALSLGALEELVTQLGVQPDRLNARRGRT
jgi:hypothetical protein